MITELTIAEVISTDDSYNYDSGDPFRIVVRSISDVNVTTYSNVRPVSVNDLNIPIPGEHVLIFKGLRSESNTSKRRYDWFYITTYSLQSTINNNLLPGVTYKIETANTEQLANEWKRYVTERSVSSLQPFPGDRIIQGRWGNRIRLSSTIKTQDVTLAKQPVWKRRSGNAGDPIIILSNTKSTTNNEFVVENPNSDYSSLYLTSTQEISGYTVTKSWKQENEYQSQFIGVADRINLNAKTDSVTINAVSNIELNSNNLVFGTSTEKEPGIHYTELKFVLDSIVTILSDGFENKSGDILVAAKNKSLLTDIKAKIQQIRNDGVWFDQRVDTLVNNNII